LGDETSNQPHTCGFIHADHNYAATYGLEPLAGRFFQKNDHNPIWDELENILLTESAVKMFGYASNEAALGQHLRFWDHNWNIVGVTARFSPKIATHSHRTATFCAFIQHTKPSLAPRGGRHSRPDDCFCAKNFHEFFPGNVFKYAFVDENFRKLYEADVRFGNILGFFTLLTMLIACLGLFGLASYTTMLRTKEIGIRKVLGASVAGITGLLAKDFLKLVGIALLLPRRWLIFLCENGYPISPIALTFNGGCSQWRERWPLELPF
jgi:putative ABC transport system permease protein